jgi:hypothetical protein
MLGGGSAVAQATPPPAPAAKASAAAAEPWKKIPIPALHAFKPVEPKRIDLANGLVIFLQEDHELPFIHGSILIRGGSRDEPAAKIGLVSLYGQTWRTSGTATLSGDALDTQLAAKAARIETGGSIATTSMSWSSLKGDFDVCVGDRSAGASGLQGGQAGSGQAADGGAHRAAQRRRRGDRGARGVASGLRRY